MNPDLQILPQSLRKLLKSYEQLSQAIPNPNEARSKADTAFAEVMALLQRPGLEASLDTVLAEVNARLQAPEELESYLQQNQETFTRTEIELARELQLRYQDFDKLVKIFLKGDETQQIVSNVAELRAQLQIMHSSFIQGIALTRQYPRKPKKWSRQKFVDGAYTSIHAVGTIALNWRKYRVRATKCNLSLKSLRCIAFSL